MTHLPTIIQGGMGVGISHWGLARAVSRRGHLGVVSGTALDQVLARRLQSGDPGGHIRRALDHFPVPRLADQVWNTFYIAGGKEATASFKTIPMATVPPTLEWQTLCVVANFVEVFLAREGHANPVGINFLEKIQVPHLPSLYGAMLAGVDYVLMGAGIPMKIPGVLDRLARHKTATYPLVVTGLKPGESVTLSFDPQVIVGADGLPLTRPKFLAIVASDILALTLQRKASGRVDGFIVESPTAGGHNAPPRGALQLNERGEPVYGARDVVNLEKLKAIGLPFWLAGGAGVPGGLAGALALGATGVQIGTAFAMSSDSGMRSDYRRYLLDQITAHTTDVFTSPKASPTGFPFKVARIPGTLSDPTVVAARPRICDLGYLREAYRADDGQVAFRCPAEPVNVYVSKGGRADETTSRVCICNALISTAGFPQVRRGSYTEPGIVTIGDGVTRVGAFVAEGDVDYSASAVLDRVAVDGIPAQPEVESKS